MGTFTATWPNGMNLHAGDELAGIVSIGDLVNACRVSAESENSQLRQYIQGVG